MLNQMELKLLPTMELINNGERAFWVSWTGGSVHS